LAVFASINTELETDQHFADAEKTVKWCGDVEERLAAAKQHALSQTESIDVLFRTIEEISAEARRKRLELEKLVKARKVSIREDIVMSAAKALQTHIDQINTSLGGKARMPTVAADFAGAIKGKKSISSLRDAADSELARAKIAASQVGDSIRANLASLVELATDYVFLFNDVQQLVLKANDDLVALIKVRISEHQKAEEAKAEAQRVQIRNEELKRIEDERNAKAVVEPAAAPIRNAPSAKTVSAVQSTSKPATAVSKPEVFQAEVTDLEALVHAVSGGLAPLSVLTVNWDELDALVAKQGSAFSMAGVRLAKIAA
jgi:hypothetical protein